MSSQSGTYDINNLFSEAQTRWLKPAEVLFILQNHEKYQLTHEPPQKPTSGSLYLFNKRVLRFFRRDGHNWRKKKDGRTVGEAHERLKVGNTEALNCYYAHGEHNPNFQRRSYWMLDPAYEHIVLVHYREITEGKPSPGSAAQLSPGSVAQPSPGSSSAFSPSPGSVEVTSEFVIVENGTDSMAEFTGSTSDEVNQYLRRLEEQLSLNEDSVKEIGPLYSREESTNDSENVQQFFKQDQPANFVHEPEALAGSQFYGGFVGTQLQRNDPILLPESGVSAAYHHSYSHGYEDGRKESPSWNELLESYETSLVAEEQEKLPDSLKRELSEEKQHSCWPNFNETGVASSSSLLLQDTSILEYNSVIETAGTASDYYSMLYDQGQLDFPVLALQQKFTIQEISPEWGYSTEATKVIIVGSFLCDPSESAWACMFGESEVPLEIIQEGVIRCEAPPHLAGKVSLCITSTNRLSCSEIREFEYREKAIGCKKCNSSQQEATKRPEELLLLFRFVQMLLSGSSIQQGDAMETGSNLLSKLKSDDDSWGYVMESLLDGSGTSSDTVDWLLQQLLKDKLLQWLSSRCPERHNEDGSSLSKKEQGIIHMVSGLGFEWALSPILSHGVCINFRDINGWTALHWAARFGREKMVAALLASGAYAGAVTDPNPHDPVGQTPASIAYSYGHKGLAGYLSELALTSHLSSLTLEESELSKGSAEVEAERTVDSISKGKLVASDDQVSLKDTLAAVRNAAQAAARIQSAFRAHSFRKRQQREAFAAASSVDEYGLKASDIEGLSTLSKLAFGNARDHNSAALSIQKKYRGWKGRKDFLEFRQKVVKIQAHVRGYQVRKHYKVCWATGILEKVVLRWRRKGVGLRGFRNEIDFIDEIEDEDILKVFRQQKVDKAIDEAVSRVLSMVDSPNARQQYHRMLQRYQLAKAELGEASNTATSVSVADVSDVDNDNMYQF